jgi:hypothetical protein
MPFKGSGASSGHGKEWFVAGHNPISLQNLFFRFLSVFRFDVFSHGLFFSRVHHGNGDDNFGQTRKGKTAVSKAKSNIIKIKDKLPTKEKLHQTFDFFWLPIFIVGLSFIAITPLVYPNCFPLNFSLLTFKIGWILVGVAMIAMILAGLCD